MPLMAQSFLPYQILNSGESNRQKTNDVLVRLSILADFLTLSVALRPMMVVGVQSKTNRNWDLHPETHLWPGGCIKPRPQSIPNLNERAFIA